MKLYHYVPKKNTALKEGLLSFASNPDADIRYYAKEAGSENKADIIRRIDSLFPGRSRAIRALTEPVQWHEKSGRFKQFAEESELFSFDLDALERDGLIESIWCRKALEDTSIAPEQYQEEIIKLDSPSQIDFSPLAWHLCNDEKGLRFSVIRYYFIVLKNGAIPPQYLTREK